MRLRLVAAMTLLALNVSAVPLVAQDFGVMNSAETINRGNFKVMANPIVVFGKGNADNDLGVAIVGGYGFTDRFDVEGKVAFFDPVNFFGADAEYWLVRNQSVDVSAIGGFHLGRGDGDFDTTALDATFLTSGHMTPRLELFGALDIARNAINDFDESFTTVHLVPGIEYAINPDLDLVAEFGIAVNDDSSHYVSVGIARYIR